MSSCSHSVKGSPSARISISFIRGPQGTACTLTSQAGTQHSVYDSLSLAGGNAVTAVYESLGALAMSLVLFFLMAGRMLDLRVRVDMFYQLKLQKYSMVFEIKRYFKLASILSDLKFKSRPKNTDQVTTLSLSDSNISIQQASDPFHLLLALRINYELIDKEGICYCSWWKMTFLLVVLQWTDKKIIFFSVLILVIILSLFNHSSNSMMRQQSKTRQEYQQRVKAQGQMQENEKVPSIPDIVNSLIQEYNRNKRRLIFWSIIFILLICYYAFLKYNQYKGSEPQGVEE